MLNDEHSLLLYYFFLTTFAIAVPAVTPLMKNCVASLAVNAVTNRIGIAGIISITPLCHSYLSCSHPIPQSPRLQRQNRL